jgi:hypothetical protein
VITRNYNVPVLLSLHLVILLKEGSCGFS